ncbi:YadA family autotransporter adhesin [Paraburkholderia flava]|uniref:YadA family autotransporter adhesin n=1 Tax=Paraburkholderia flava TaxID=2547393 RepID=UPI001F0FCD31|nr:YadA-like family protein [Paraburkholderia flava]
MNLALAQTAPPASNSGYFAAFHGTAGVIIDANGTHTENPSDGNFSFSIGNTGDGNGYLESANNVSNAVQIVGLNNGTLAIKSSKVEINATVDMKGHLITGLMPATVSPDSTDAVNGAQLSSLSTSVSTGIGSLSTGLSTANGDIGSLSTRLGTANSNIGSLSTGLSTANGNIGSLSTGLSTAASNVSSLSTVVADSVQYDSPDHTKVTLGGANSQKPVALANVADGVQPTDAVNVSQLTSLSTSTLAGIGSLSTALGTTNSNVLSLSTSVANGMSSLSTGLSTTGSNVSSLSTSIANGMSSLSTGLSTTDGNVASLATSVSTGIGSLSTGVANVGAQLSSLSTGIYERVEQIRTANGVAADMKGTGADKPTVTAGANSAAIGANSNDGGRRNVVSIGNAAQQRQLVNVAEGTQATDAVNLDQLNRVTSDGMRQANSYTDRRIAGVQQSIDQTARNAYSGIAAVTALSMIGDVDKDKTIALGVGVGTYRGYQAVAVSATARLTDNLQVRAGAGVTSGSSAAGVGATMQW